MDSTMTIKSMRRIYASPYQCTPTRCRIEIPHGYNLSTVK